MTPDTITVDDVIYQRAGIVVDGVVYLRDESREELENLTERIIAQLKKTQDFQGWRPTS